MPLRTQWVRDGITLKPSWDWKVLSAFMTAAFKEGSPDLEVREGLAFGDLETGQYVDFSMAPIYYMQGYCKLIDEGEQVLEQDHEFNIGENRILEFKKGDVLKCWRESSVHS